MKNHYKEAARDIITTYLTKLADKQVFSNKSDGNNFNDIAFLIFQLKEDDELLLEHIEAMKNIFTKAALEIKSEAVQKHKKERKNGLY